MNGNASSAVAIAPTCLRPLKWNELVKRGDFVEDGRKGFEPWVGPSGFRAAAFVKQIYRQLGRRSPGAKKTA